MLDPPGAGVTVKLPDVGTELCPLEEQQMVSVAEHLSIPQLAFSEGVCTSLTYRKSRLGNTNNKETALVLKVESKPRSLFGGQSAFCP